MCKNKTLFFNRHLPHYRSGIYRLMEKELGIHFFPGDKRPGGIKKLDYSLLQNIKELKNYDFGPFYWQKGAVSLLFKPFKNYITPGDYNCLSTWIIIVMAKFLGKKIIFWTHGWYGDESLIKKKFKKIFYSFSDKILLYNTYSRDLMLKEGFKESKLHVIYNSLDYEKQIELRKKAQFSNIFTKHFQNNHKTLIYIGRLTSRKRLDLILEALNNLKSEGHFFNMVFIGSGPVQEELKDLAQSLNLLKNTWFFGECYTEDKIAEFLYNADMCVSPGATGLTSIHSLMYGTPVITHDNFSKQGPEFEAVLEGVTGTFFSYNDPKSLACKILNWFMLFPEKNMVQHECFKMVDEKFNPYFQIKVLNQIL